MSEHPISQGRRDRLLETASDWVVRIQEGELSPGELDAWIQWLEASPGHQRAFDDVQSLWGKMGKLPHTPAVPPKAELRDDAYTGEQRVRTWLSNPASRRRLPRRFRALGIAAGIVAAFGLAFAAWEWLGPEPGPVATAYRTVTGQHQLVNLPDGSRVELGAASSVVVRYSPQQRAVELLDGVAYFDVARNANRPFVVHAGGGSVTAIGTAFSVQRRASEVTVVVSDGLVEVAKPMSAAVSSRADPQRQPEIVQLPAGQRVAYSSGAGLELPTTTDVDAATAWREGQLVFQDESLAKAIEDVNRYSRIRIELSDPELAELRLTGYVVTAQVDGWLSGLETVLPVTVTRYPDRIELSYRRDRTSE